MRFSSTTFTFLALFFPSICFSQYFELSDYRPVSGDDLAAEMAPLLSIKSDFLGKRVAVSGILNTSNDKYRFSNGNVFDLIRVDNTLSISDPILRLGKYLRYFSPSINLLIDDKDLLRRIKTDCDHGWLLHEFYGCEVVVFGVVEEKVLRAGTWPRVVTWNEEVSILRVEKILVTTEMSLKVIANLYKDFETAMIFKDLEKLGKLLQ